MKLYRWRCKHCGCEWDSTSREGERCDVCKTAIGTRVYAVNVNYHPSKGR